MYTDGTIRYGLLSDAGEPTNLTGALEDKQWKHAMDEEYTTLMDNKTRHLVPPSSTKISLNVSVSTGSRKMLMVQWNDRKHDWLQKGLNRGMVLTMRTLSVLLLSCNG
jgi:hypothetical protein